MFTLLLTMCLVTPDTLKPGQPSFDCFEKSITGIKSIDLCKAQAYVQEMVAKDSKEFSVIHWEADCVIDI